MTTFPFLLAFVLAVITFAVFTAVMIHAQRCAEGRDSPFSVSFWHTL